MRSLPIGKLRAETLQAIFDKHHTKDPRVVVGPRVGEDAAVIDMGDRYLIATSDPITFATAESGGTRCRSTPTTSRFAAPVRGGSSRPLLLPPGPPTDATVEALFAELHAACEELEVALVGGHTEVTHGLDRPIVAGTMLGEVDRDRLVHDVGRSRRRRGRA
jgi:hydrogenase maturation factor